MYPIFLKKNPLCEIQGPNCLKQASVVHHRKGRGKVDVTNTATFVACCPPCNSWVEANDAKARKLGFKKSKFHE